MWENHSNKDEGVSGLGVLPQCVFTLNVQFSTFFIKGTETWFTSKKKFIQHHNRPQKIGYLRMKLMSLYPMRMDLQIEREIHNCKEL